MKINIQAISDKGCVRSENEDLVLVQGDMFRNDRRDLEISIGPDTKPFFLAVADGMGGHQAGEVASEKVVSGLRDRIKSVDPCIMASSLRSAFDLWVDEIHQGLLDEGAKDPGRQGMGSTFVGLIFSPLFLGFINIGDSRLYRFRDGILRKLSRDHSLREMSGNPQIAKNIIVNSFGGGDKIFYEFEEITNRVFNGDVFLLCSDGLCDELADEEIEVLLSRGLSAEAILKKAKESGGRDNISLILASINKED